MGPQRQCAVAVFARLIAEFPQLKGEIDEW